MQFVTLTEAIGVHPKDVLACVGAGGKTSICWRLWANMRAAAQLSIFTTTTHIFEPILPQRSALLLSLDPDPAYIESILARTTGLVLAASRSTEQVNEFTPNPVAPARPVKLKGLSPPQLDRLIDALPGITWLVEADGARGRGLKLPAAHEPAIPTRATIVVVLVHLDSIGRPLDETVAHRAKHLAKFLGITEGSAVSTDHIVRLMNDPTGGLKNIPPSSRVVAVLNQRNEAEPHPQAGYLAAAILASGRYQRVVSASLQARHPVLEVYTA